MGAETTPSANPQRILLDEIGLILVKSTAG
jgi:hypothetical protein